MRTLLTGARRAAAFGRRVSTSTTVDVGVWCDARFDTDHLGPNEGPPTLDRWTVDLADGASGRYVIVWFTEISTGGEQWFRARLAGASATS